MHATMHKSHVCPVSKIGKKQTNKTNIQTLFLLLNIHLAYKHTLTHAQKKMEGHAKL